MADLGWDLPMGAAEQLQRTSDYITAYEKAFDENQNSAREDILNAVKQGNLIDCGDEAIDPSLLICELFDVRNFKQLVTTAIATTNGEQIADEFKKLLDKAISEAVDFIAEQRTNNMEF